MLQTCLKKLGQHELRQTETRRLLLELFHQASGPLAPPDIVVLCHRAGRQANKTTVYRDLSAMERAGIIRKVIVSDRKQYFELSERGHHHHLICWECDRVEDVVFAEEADFLKKSRSLVEQRGFSILEHAIEFFGVCKQCSS